MKTRFEDLTREQILALTEDDIRYYTDYRLAENGVVLPPHPGEAPEEKEFPEPTEIAYECRGILVTDIEEAKKLATLETVVSTSYDGDYSYKYLTEGSNYNSGVEKKLYYKKEVLKEFKSELQQYKKEKSAYSTDLSEYNKAVKESESVTNFITEICYAVAAEDRYITQAKERYAELLELAQNNDQIAYNFFMKAFPEEITVQKLEDFYEEDTTYGIKTLTYDQFATKCGIKLPAEEKAE